MRKISIHLGYRLRAILYGVAPAYKLSSAQPAPESLKALLLSGQPVVPCHLLPHSQPDLNPDWK
jgi:hypothetical protein